MPPSSRRLVRRLLLLLAALAVAVVAVPAARAADGPRVAQDEGEGPAGPVVDILQLEGAVDPPAVAAIRDLVVDAGERGSALLLVQVDSPGGLAVDREDVVDAVREAEVPVVIWVGPGAAQAGGAAVFLAAAGDLAAIARDASVGPACPVTAGASACTQEDVARLGDLFGGATGGDQGGDLDLPVEERWTAQQAVEAGLIDLTVGDYASLLQDLDGREVTTAAGARTLALPEQDLTVRLHTLGLLRRILHASLDPVLVAFLLVGLLLLIAFEVFQPGFGVAGVAALLVAPLLIYGLVVMPVTWWAVALLAVGTILLGIDLAIAGLGPPTFLGAAATVVGLWWLFPDGSPILHVPTWVNVTLAAFTVLYFVVIMTVVLRAQAGPELDTAAEELVGEVGVVRSTMNPEGHVFIDGALWRARWTGPDVGRVRTGTTVRVSDVEGTLLLVEPTDREPARP